MSYESIITELLSVNIRHRTLYDKINYFVFRKDAKRSLLVIGGFRGYEYNLTRALFKLTVLLKRSYKYKFKIVVIPCIDIYGFNGLRELVRTIKPELNLNVLREELKGYTDKVRVINKIEILKLLNGKTIILGKDFTSLKDINKLRDEIIKIPDLFNLLGEDKVALYILCSKYLKLYGDKFITLDYTIGKLLFLDELLEYEDSWLCSSLRNLIEETNTKVVIVLREIDDSKINILLPRHLLFLSNSITRILESQFRLTIICGESGFYKAIGDDVNVMLLGIPFTLNSTEKIEISLSIVSMLCNIIAHYL